MTTPLSLPEVDRVQILTLVDQSLGTTFLL
jgi:hypothetical protein